MSFSYQKFYLDDSDFSMLPKPIRCNTCGSPYVKFHDTGVFDTYRNKNIYILVELNPTDDGRIHTHKCIKGFYINKYENIDTRKEFPRTYGWKTGDQIIDSLKGQEEIAHEITLGLREKDDRPPLETKSERKKRKI